MTMFDYVVGITIGSIAAELATELKDPVRPLAAIIVYAFTAVGISALTNKSIRLRTAVTGKPLVLLENGVIYRENLKKARLDLHEFLTYCRIGGWFDLKSAAVGSSGAQWCGELSAEGDGASGYTIGSESAPCAVLRSDPLCHGRRPFGGQCPAGGKGRELGAEKVFCGRGIRMLRMCCWRCGTAARS